MGLFSDIISSIGNAASDVFGGGGNNNDDNKRKQPQAPTISAPQNNTPTVKLPSVLQMVKTPEPANTIRPVSIGNSPQPNNPLAGPPAPAAAPQIGTSSYGAPSTSLFGHLLHGATDVVKGVAQPFVNTGEDVSNGIGNGEVDLAHALGIHAGQTESNQQQFGGINNAVGLKTEANTPKNFALNAAQVAGTVLAPEADA